MSDRCKHRWADSPSDVGEGIYCIRCGDMAFAVEHLLDRALEPALDDHNVTDLRKRIEALEAYCDTVCPCEDGKPDPCTLCGATVESGVCGAGNPLLPELKRLNRVGYAKLAAVGEWRIRFLAVLGSCRDGMSPPDVCAFQDMTDELEAILENDDE